MTTHLTRTRPRTRPWSVAVAVAGLLAATVVLVVAAPPASATGTLGSFSPGVVPIGGSTQANAHSCAPAGSDVAVEITPPASAAVVVPAPTNASGQLWVRLGGTDGLVSLDAVGTWSVTIDCPDGTGPTTSTVDVVAPDGDFITRIGVVPADGVPPDCDAAQTVGEELPLGRGFYLCVELTNTTSASTTSAALRGATSASQTIVIPPGGSHTIFAGQFIAGLHGPDLPVWGELRFDDGDGGTATQYSPVLAATQAAGPPLAMAVGLGLDEASACGGPGTLTVEPGTEITICYQVTNLGDRDLTDHRLLDARLGTIAGASPAVLGPGEQATATVTEVVPSEGPATLEYDATWALDEHNPFEGPIFPTGDDTPFVASAAATATVPGPEGPDGAAGPGAAERVPSPAPQDDPVAPAAPATAAAASPTFAG